MSLTNMIASADASLATTQWAFRNRIINGNANIAQRGTSFTFGPGTSGYGGPDRFQATNGGAADGEFTQSQGTITYNGVMKNAVVQTVNTPISSTTTTNYWRGIEQAIEGYNCYDLPGQPVTVSFIFETNVSGNYSFALVDGTNANSYVSSFVAVANTPMKVVISVPMLPLTLGLTNNNMIGLQVVVGFLNTGTFQTSVLNTWQTGTYLSASTATNWGTTAGNYIALTDLQLEAGYTATSFENRHMSVELAMCQRYYQVYTMWKFWMYAGSAGEPCGQVSDIHYMRTVPTIAYVSVTYSNAYGLDFEDLYENCISYYVYSTTAGAVTVQINGVMLSAEL